MTSAPATGVPSAFNTRPATVAPGSTSLEADRSCGLDKALYGGGEQSRHRHLAGDEVAHRRVDEQEHEPARELSGRRENGVFFDRVVRGVFGLGRVHLAIEEKRDHPAPRIGGGKGLGPDGGRSKKDGCRYGEDLVEARVHRLFEDTVSVTIEAQLERRCRGKQIERQHASITDKKLDG